MELISCCGISRDCVGTNTPMKRFFCSPKRLLLNSMNTIYVDVKSVNSLFVQTRALYSPKDEVIGYVASDPAFFHAALAHTALHLCNLSPERPYLDLFYHHGQSIHMLNNRIKSSNIAETLHTTIAAISCLTNLEVPTQPLLSPSLSISVSNVLNIFRWKEKESMVPRFI
jgi:hypothetical protein